MITIQKYVRAQSLEEAWQLNQNKRNRILGGMLWLRLGKGSVGTAIDLCDLGLNTIEETEEAFSIEILTVAAHFKRGKYVVPHLHLNVTYLLEANPADPVRCKEDENKAVGWFTLDGAIAASKEPWFQERVYQKLNAKLVEFCRKISIF